MVDSDIFFDDSEINPIEIERKLFENEQRKREKEIYNKGYLDGLEFAESNYLTFILENSDEQMDNGGNHWQHFKNGVDQGIQEFERKKDLYSEAGALNAYMLLADSKPIQMQDERQEIRSMLERLNLGMGSTQVDPNIIQDSQMIRQRIDANFEQH